MENERNKAKSKQRGERNSSLELFRIITMLVIIAHHYVVNSGLTEVLQQNTSVSFNSVFLCLFGWGGKTGINCFVLITGYFMCKSNITLKKFFCEHIAHIFFIRMMPSALVLAYFETLALCQ